MKKRIGLMVLGVILITSPLRALFEVYDPINYAKAVAILAEMVKSYDQLKSQFDLQSFLATVVPVDMSARYRATGAAWNALPLPYDRFGNLGAFSQAVNQGGPAASAYDGASIALQPYGGAISQLSNDEQMNAASRYASVELADGVNIDSMQTIGMLRANASATNQALAGLESDSLSSDPSMNSEIAVLNKISAASVAGLRTARDANLLLLGTLQQQLVESKRQRDADASEINVEIARLQQGAAAKAQYTSTVTETLTSFRWR